MKQQSVIRSVIARCMPLLIFIFRHFTPGLVFLAAAWPTDAQNMDKGFALLNTRQYGPASNFFDSLLAQRPGDRTVRLCLARATGLSGNYSRSGQLLDQLAAEMPGDREVLVNKAEWWLWQSEPVKAEAILQDLIVRFPDDAAVLINYCNAAIVQKEYPLALSLLARIHAITKGASPWPEMLKNLRLNYALQYRQKERYPEAISQLDSLLLQLKDDPNALMLKGDILLQSKQFSAAVPVYAQLAAMNYEKTTVLINGSYALFMEHKPRLALRKALDARTSATPSPKLALINYFNALLWNLRIAEAQNFLSQNAAELSAPERLVLHARLDLSRGNYDRGLSEYDSLVRAYPQKAYIQEYAEVLLGKKQRTQAVALMQSAKGLFTPSEFAAWQDKADAAERQKVGIEEVHFKDVGENIRMEHSVFWQGRPGTMLQPGVKTGYVTVSLGATDQETHLQYTNVSLSEQWNRAWSGQSAVQLQEITAEKSPSSSVITGRQTLQYQPTDRFFFAGQYSSEVLNYTAALLQQHIILRNIGYATNWMITPTTGFFSQGGMGLLSDENRRLLFFGSLYHLLRTEPTIKLGLNYTAVHYSNDTVTSYFSPNLYQTGELFADYSTALPTLSKWYLTAQAAAGWQRIETGNWQPTYRLQLETCIHLKHFESSLKYQTSNVAAANGLGYKFNWFTWRAAFIW